MSKRKGTPSLVNKLSGLTYDPDEQEVKEVAPPKRARESKGEKEKPKEEPRVDLRGRATYQIGIELKESIKEESVRLGVPASQFAKYLLLFAWDDYLNGRIPPPTLLESDSPAYMNNIDFDD